MTPSQTAAHLRQIASKLDNSTKPDRALVVKDLKRVLANMGAPPAEGQQAQQQQEALPQSGAGKGMLKKMLEDAQAALDKGDEAGFKALLDKLSKHS